MSGTLKDALGLPEAKQATNSESVEKVRELFLERMGDLNRSLQLIAGQAGPKDFSPLDSQRMKLYEAFQKTAALIEQGDSNISKESVKRMLAALESIQGKAADTATGVAAGRDEWLAREDDFDNLVVQIGELEDAGNPKAATLRKLADSIRARANECDYGQSVSALDQLQPKFNQIYQQYQQTAYSAPSGAPAASGKADQLGGMFPEIVGEQLQSELKETESLIAQLEEAGFPRAPKYRKSLIKIRELAQSKATMEAVAGHNRLREVVDADMAVLNKSRLGGVRLPEDDGNKLGVDIPVGGATPTGKKSLREPLQIDDPSAKPAKDNLKGLGGFKQVEVKGSAKEPLAADFFPEGLPANPDQPQDTLHTPRGQGKAPAAPQQPAQAAGGALLKQGAKGAEVKKLQQLLKIADDGDFGPATLAAVKAFQTSKGLKADGIVGPQTWTALGSSSSYAPPTPPPAYPTQPPAQGPYPPQPPKKGTYPPQPPEQGPYPPEPPKKGTYPPQPPKQGPGYPAPPPEQYKKSYPPQPPEEPGYPSPPPEQYKKNYPEQPPKKGPYPPQPPKKGTYPPQPPAEPEYPTPPEQYQENYAAQPPEQYEGQYPAEPSSGYEPRQMEETGDKSQGERIQMEGFAEGESGATALPFGIDKGAFLNDATRNPPPPRDDPLVGQNRPVDPDDKFAGVKGTFDEILGKLGLSGVFSDVPGAKGDPAEYNPDSPTKSGPTRYGHLRPKDGPLESDPEPVPPAPTNVDPPPPPPQRTWGAPDPQPGDPNFIGPPAPPQPDPAQAFVSQPAAETIAEVTEGIGDAAKRLFGDE